ncbi:alpha/beta fold hydrolase [Martelella mediterranea]|uniref:Proline iminopeptidase n=1 Tax=Martelella mediterranea TaxID=293089 RepID=A0A4R3NU97_9HYPH|nr:alpha/beta fold hydrolase [Martelella mediterranea]TCT39319.1 proline iminopeptidase [Martelella mediterranea]
MTDFLSPVAGSDDRFGILESGGFLLSFRIEGQGLPVVVIGSADYYARCFPAVLRSDLRFHFIDHCGFATAIEDHKDSDFSLERIVADIERMRVRLGLERFAILGHSGHGYMALAYAARYREHVSHVAMIATAPSQSKEMLEAADRRFEEEADETRRAILSRDIASLATDNLNAPNTRFKHLLIRLGARSWNDPTYDARWLWSGVPINDAAFDHLWGEVFRDIDVRFLAEKVEAPVLIALGANDYLIAPPESWTPLLPMFRRAETAKFDRSGHTPPLEEPEHFAERLLCFLRNA